MTVNIGLITTAVITQHELSDFVWDIGGKVVKDQGQLHQDDASIWIHLYPENLKEVLRDNGEAVMGKLGEMPHSWVDINLSSRKGSDRLALQFAASFMARWHAILDDCHGGFHSREEVLQFQASGQPLWTLLEASLERTLQSRD